MGSLTHTRKRLNDCATVRPFRFKSRQKNMDSPCSSTECDVPLSFIFFLSIRDAWTVRRHFLDTFENSSRARRYRSFLGYNSDRSLNLTLKVLKRFVIKYDRLFKFSYVDFDFIHISLHSTHLFTLKLWLINNINISVFLVSFSLSFSSFTHSLTCVLPWTHQM